MERKEKNRWKRWMIGDGKDGNRRRRIDGKTEKEKEKQEMEKKGKEEEEQKNEKTEKEK